MIKKKIYTKDWWFDHRKWKIIAQAPLRILPEAFAVVKETEEGLLKTPLL